MAVATKDTVEAVAAPASTPNGSSTKRYLTREDILGADDIRSEDVEVPEWGGTVMVRGMSGRERDAFERTTIETRGNKVESNLANFRAKIVRWTVVAEDGSRLFTEADVEALGRKSAAALQRVYEVATKLSGLTSDDVEELTEGLKGAPSGDSGSD